MSPRHKICTALAAAFMLAVQAPARADNSTDTVDCASADMVKTDPARVLAACRRLADQGYPVAQYQLAIIYWNGQGVPKDYAQSVRWFRKAAEQGHTRAQFFLGFAYENGVGTTQNFANAATWYRKAAEQGYGDAQFSLGSLYSDGKGLPRDYVQAARWYRKAAEQGDWSARYELGFLYYLGLGVPQDYVQAAQWVRKAAEQGLDRAQNQLGYMYESGQGVPKDYVQAVDWYRKSAKNGNAEGQRRLGDSYRDGKGVRKDDVLAYAWLNLATTAGDAFAAKDRDAIEKQMTPEQIGQAQKLTGDWRPGFDGEMVAYELAFSENSTSVDVPAEIFGSGFFVTQDGKVLTNAHVIEGCSKLSVRLGDTVTPAHMLARDVQNDLALIAAEVRPSLVARLRLSPRQGENAAVYGFPLAGLLSSGGNLTSGNVTALSGLADDTRFLQISVPVQLGNSGSPLFDQTGNVIGIIVSKLDALKMASITSDIPQNVNFAIKAAVAASFLDSNGVAYLSGQSGEQLSDADIAERARAFTARVECTR